MEKDAVAILKAIFKKRRHHQGRGRGRGRGSGRGRGQQAGYWGPNPYWIPNPYWVPRGGNGDRFQFENYGYPPSGPSFFNPSCPPPQGSQTWPPASSKAPQKLPGAPQTTSGEEAPSVALDEASPSAVNFKTTTEAPITSAQTGGLQSWPPASSEAPQKLPGAPQTTPGEEAPSVASDATLPSAVNLKTTTEAPTEAPLKHQ